MNTIDIAVICKALGDYNRLQIVQILSDGEMCGCKLLEAFDDFIAKYEKENLALNERLAKLQAKELKLEAEYASFINKAKKEANEIIVKAQEDALALISEIEKKFENANYGEFKRSVADVVCDFLATVQEKYKDIIESGKLDQILNDGANKVREISKKKFDDMKVKIGLYR